MKELGFDEWKSHLDLITEDIERDNAERQHDESQDKPSNWMENVYGITTPTRSQTTKGKEMSNKALQAAETAEEDRINQETRNINVFKTLNKIDVNKHTEKKGKFTYLSWAWAVSELLKNYPTATWEVKRFDGLPYLKSDTGFYVEVEVDINGVKRSQLHPVLDNFNKPIVKPNSFQINTSIQRCLAKVISLHGLGLYIYAGEDLPEVVKEEGDLKVKYFHLLKKAHKDGIPVGIINNAKSMSKNDFILAITNLEGSSRALSK